MRLVCRSHCSSCGSNSLRGLSAARGFSRPVTCPSLTNAGRGEAGFFAFMTRFSPDFGRAARLRTKVAIKRVNPGPISLNVCARRFPPQLRTRRRPDGASRGSVRFARVMKRALDFHGKPHLLKSFHNETQALAHLASGSRICRHGVLRMNAPSLRAPISEKSP